MVTGDNESPFHDSLSFPRDATRHEQSNQSNCDHNDSLEATLPTPEQDPPMAAQDPIHRLADSLTSLQNRPELTHNSLFVQSILIQ